MGLEDNITIDSKFLDASAKRILTPEALRFVAGLVGESAGFRSWLLQRREERQKEYNSGRKPAFVVDALGDYEPREDPSWKVAPHPKDLRRRWVEITGPASNRKMIINALNSGADCYMADFEDSDVPTWKNLINGQINLMDAVDWTISEKVGDKEYKLHDQVATLLVRPRGWHLDEKHVLFEGRPIPAALFDFGLYFFHNAKALVHEDATPAFYLPKMESNLEALLWQGVFEKAQEDLDIPYGTIRATVLIETLPAAFEMEEILYQLKDHISGLNCGRWDYIFSYIKTLQNDPYKIVPDRDLVNMRQPFLSSYVDLLVQTCHKRGAYAMGGMAAQIPLKDPAENEKALRAVEGDKIRELTKGHDGTWVAHPGLVPFVRKIFETGLQGHDHQLYQQTPGYGNIKQVTAEDLLEVPEGTLTYAGLRKNINIGIRYIESWLRGNGCVALEGKMEDAATAEISRAQVWQWLRHQATIEDGRMVNKSMFNKVVSEVTSEIIKEVGADHYHVNSKYPEATSLFCNLIEQEQRNNFEPFLTIPAYEHLLRIEK